MHSRKYSLFVSKEKILLVKLTESTTVAHKFLDGGLGQYLMTVTGVVGLG